MGSRVIFRSDVCPTETRLHMDGNETTNRARLDGQRLAGEPLHNATRCRINIGSDSQPCSSHTAPGESRRASLHSIINA